MLLGEVKLVVLAVVLVDGAARAVVVKCLALGHHIKLHTKFVQVVGLAGSLLHVLCVLALLVIH